ncbi:MAG TPA: right-handed parallel beta-helix repeat-containing protein [Thermoanaerobaculia bacterium]|jgi:hypothetical protein
MRSAARLSAAVATVFMVLASAASAGVLYVNASATGSDNGSSWADAFTSLPPALASANSGDEIWVAAATYKPATVSDRTVSIALKNGVGVYGGFNGTETMRSQRDPLVNVTILSGDIGTPGSAIDNSYHVVTAAASVTNTGVVDGFTITAGQADGAPAANNDRGAGMWVNGGAPTISHMTFTGNFAQAEGGGLRITSGAPLLLSCLFQGNSAGFGGKGGGLYAGGGSSVTAQSCVFRSNSISASSTGGGGLETAGAAVTVINSIFAQNSPNGLQVASVDGSVIDNCTFTGNAGYGAAFVSSNSNTISNTIFWGDSTGELCTGVCLGSASVTYSDVQGGFAGTGNVSADPLFIQAPGDLRPGPGSPAVDSGSNFAVTGGVIVDVVGLPRFFDDPDVPDTGIGLPGTPIVDMGAYERVPLIVSAPPDLTVCSGSSAVFPVTASGQAPLSYQWRKNGVNLVDGGSISGVHTTTLTIDPTGAGDPGTYDIVVTDNFHQSLASTPATLAVNTTPTASASGTAAICTGNSTLLNGSGGVSCSWSPTAGLSDASVCAPSASPTITTVYTLTVTAANGCLSTNAPTVTVTVNQTPATPIITAPLSLPIGASGASASVTDHPGSIFTWILQGGTITGGQTTRQIAFDAGSAGTTMHCTVFETNSGCSSPVASRNIQVDFNDVPPSHQFHDFVDTVARNQITVGCTGGNYCPDQQIPRSQMAVFLLKAKFGSDHVPPPETGTIFGDVPVGSFAAAWIEELYNLGVTGGCTTDPLNFCPDAPVTRAQMAVFLLKDLLGSDYVPPGASGTIFADVPLGTFAADWIEDFYGRGITGGCAVSPLRYCPDKPVTRGEMSVFVTKTFELQ